MAPADQAGPPARRQPSVVLRRPLAPSSRSSPEARRRRAANPARRHTETRDDYQSLPGPGHRRGLDRRGTRAGRAPESAGGVTMMFLMDPEFWMRVVGIIVIDLTLAGDNALVIALAVRTLPKRQQFWGRIWGTAGAVGLRLLFITVATLLLKVPFLQLVGGLLLLWIAVKLVRQQTGAEGHVRHGGSLREAIWIIIVADAVMSLDNVLAVAAAAHGDLTLVVFGIALSLPIVVWGSGLLATLMNRFVWIIWLGGGILGYVAGEMILKERHLERLIDPTNPAHDLLPILPAVIIVALGWWFSIQNGRKKVPENA